MPRDILSILPFDVWVPCIAEACRGDHYMANLLTFTMVSISWRRLLTDAQALWTAILVRDTDEDSMAMVASFLHLSGALRLSLKIWIPLSNIWEIIRPMLLDHQHRIHEVILQTDAEFHGAQCILKVAIGNTHLGRTLRYIFEEPCPLGYLDATLASGGAMESVWAPSGLVSIENWIIPFRVPETLSHPFLRLGRLSMSAADLTYLFPHLSELQCLHHLDLHSTEREYALPHPPPSDHVGALHLPFINTLRFHGSMYWASMKLLTAVAPTVQHLDLCIGFMGLKAIIPELGVSKSLRSFSLTLMLLEYDFDGSNQRRPYSWKNLKNLMTQVKIPNWRLKWLEEFKYETKSVESEKIPQNLDFDPLWQFFHTIFPRIRALVWNVPIQSTLQLAMLAQQKRLQHFESNSEIVPSSRKLTKVENLGLGSVCIKDLHAFHGMSLYNLQHLSAHCHEEFRRLSNFKFTLLHSLNLKISDGVENAVDISVGELPILKCISITFVGSCTRLRLPDLLSLTEITISTRLPTFTQGMGFCASLIYNPRLYRRLEQISLDSLLEWDILYLMLRRRNLLRDEDVSRIKRLSVSNLPPKFYSIFVPLLGGRDMMSPLPFWGFMTQLSIRGAQSGLLDHHIMGCFCCVQSGLTSCKERLRGSRIPKQFSTTGNENRVFSDVVEPLGLFPGYNWDIPIPGNPSLRGDENIWMVGRQAMMANWRTAACRWSKSYQRTLICHKQLCGPKTMMTEYDIEREEGRSEPFNALFTLTRHDEFSDVIRDDISSLIECLNNEDSEARFAAASVITTLAGHASRRDAIEDAIPSLIKLLNSKKSYTLSSVVSLLTQLADYAQLHDAIGGAIPFLIKLLNSKESLDRSSAISLFAKLADYVELRDTIGGAIPFLITLLNSKESFDRSSAISLFAKLADYAELRGAFGDAIPSLIELLEHWDSGARSVAASVLIKLASYAELRNAIGGAISTLIELLNSKESYNHYAASVLTKFAGYAELHDAFGGVIPSLSKLLQHRESGARSVAASLLTKLAGYVELRDTIPSLIKLLNSEESYNRSSAASVLTKFADHVELHDTFRDAIPSLIELLNSKESDCRSSTTSLLIKLAGYAALRHAFGAVIPSLSGLLQHRDSDACSGAASLLTKLAGYVELSDAIGNTIPSLIKLFNSEKSYDRSSAISLFAKLADYVELRDTIGGAIPSLITLLNSKKSYYRSSTISLFAKLADYAHLRDAIGGVVPSLIKLLNSKKSYGRSSAISLFAKLADYAELRGAFGDAIPSVIGLLGNWDPGARSVAASVLTKLVGYGELHNAFRDAIPFLIRLLENLDSHTRFSSASLLTKLADHADLIDLLRGAISSLKELLKDENVEVRSVAASALSKLIDRGDESPPQAASAG